MQLDPECTSPDRPSDAAIPDRIPVFPLPNVVFFPKTYLPLHIFEPRYRDMIADATAGGRFIGMALLKEGWEREYYGNPPVFEVGCVGRLVNVQRLPDGRYNVLLQGLQRYVVHEQFYDKPYRQARIVVTPGEHTALEPAVRAQLLRLVAEQLGHGRLDRPTAGMNRLDLRDDVLVNSLSADLDFSPLEKQFLLEAETLLQQARRLIDLMQFKRCERDGRNKLREV